MAEISKFFNAVEIAPGVFDREYQASDFADYLDSMLSSGLINTDDIPGVIVSVESGTLNTIVSPGKAIIKGHSYKNTTPLTLTHNIPEATLNRIDRIVLRWDTRNQSRFIRAFVKEGLPSATPIAPVLQRDNFIYELSLAQILIRANTVQLLAIDLVDERLDENLCGLATWNPKVPTGQFQKQWDDFMAGIVDEGFATVESVQEVDTKLTTHKADYVNHPGISGTGGTSKAYTVTLDPAPLDIQEFFGITIIPHITNVASPTLTINGLGVIALKDQKGVAYAAGKLLAGKPYMFRKIGTDFLADSGGGGEYGTAIESQVLAPYTIGTETGLKTGTMVNRGAPTLSMTSAAGVAIPAGYYSGGIAKLSVVAGDLVAYEDLANKNTYSTSMLKVKEVRIEVSGTYRITFDLSHNNTAAYGINIQGQIYKNGSPFGSLYSISPSGSGDGYGPGYSAYTQDLYFNAGELCQLYIRKASNDGVYCMTRQLKLATGMPPLVVKIL